MAKTSQPDKPHFVIKNKFQKGGRKYNDLLDAHVLSDVCYRITGSKDYTVEFDEEGYNIGRLAILSHGTVKSYISFSENEIRSRNSSFQSLPSALSRFILDPITDNNKNIYFYILPKLSGNFKTPYFIFMYRLMATVGVNLLNIKEHVSENTSPFSSPEDIIIHKERLNSSGAGNRPTYVTRSTDGVVQIYGKTYGANKYESTLLCLALVKIAHTDVELYEVQEGGLNTLPQTSKDAIYKSGAVSISTSTEENEIIEYNTNDSLRSPRFIYNLLEKFGKKKCALCDCEIPQIIQGAHIWPVASIKQENMLSLDDKLRHALSGHNGLWLCENHHKLFDTGMLLITTQGVIKYKNILGEKDADYVRNITTSSKIDLAHISPDFTDYISRRNTGTSELSYLDLSITCD